MTDQITAIKEQISNEIAKITTPVNRVPAVTEAWLTKFLTKDPDCIRLKHLVRKWAGVQDPVLITGESGTGKELIAQALHGNRKGFFIPVNCAGFVANEGLMESLLFGHVKGSFTGAVNTNDGLVRAAENGTLFLDEIAELPLTVQAKLLRLVQEKKIRRLGSVDEVGVEVRIICATKENIESLVHEKKFREDLYYRLAIGRLHIKPLRERVCDVELILKHWFDGKIPAEFPMPNLETEEFNGNVRSLYILCRRFLVESGLV